MHKKEMVKFGLLILLIAAAVYIFRFTSLADQLSYTSVKAFVERFGVWSWAIFIIIYAALVTVFVPGTVMSFAGAILFGPWLGTLLNVAGATSGAVVGFFISRLLGRKFVQTLIEGKMDKFEKMVHENAFKGVLFVRIVPLFPYVAINYTSGLLKMHFKDYFFGSLIGMIPGSFAYTFLFASLGEQALTEGITLQSLLTPSILIPIGVFALLIAIPIILKKRAKL
ncbi:MAG: TVP38/TMEM64 family protein [Candidatus Woesearchaeota archaeon]|jgi:uncharacterized membrane protein YdjX (TVP38/TMEM64 family)|nr:TVP38/TMEM64 family protein [Candidatus Woesearchaeota archaeon]MDP7181514.1 TVP38/TMEM64 family protein [Candidatus Woesearchaeota archaeon]MDP7198556.1 TVP38/TMEM64 family protein [Candidatus Woesearchaeota archaeon]MDP7466702.1 TVP38/TMEM64 family protein [Candidatus Woesearchaeota archaeon]MDP7647195.1 TVP38/TMEM64 family protein [Candidatus Woesearchaeota archaeon]